MSREDMVAKLKLKRKEIATREGKELFMILSNATIDEMVRLVPKTKEELIQVKGWGEKKLERYGVAFLEVLCDGEYKETELVPEENTGPKRIKIQIGQEQMSLLSTVPIKKKKKSTREKTLRSTAALFGTDSMPLLDVGVQAEKDNSEENIVGSNVLSVSEFLGNVNVTFAELGLVKIKGEIADVSIRTGYAFFELKESIGGFSTEASMGCFVSWRCLDAVKHLLEAGMEVVISGYPKIYVKNGSFRLEVTDVEPVGEGALQKAFEALKRKLQEKGYFDEARKRPIPPFIRKIGLVTSMIGAAVIDFQKNLGDGGYLVECLDVRVEGESAEENIVRAIKYFNEYKRDLDVLVLIRGGGSLQSLKAFNSERIADALYYSRIPVITGIGHERDETIAGFVADLNCSTPTAVANFLRTQHEALESNLTSFTTDLFSTLEYKIRETHMQLGHQTESLSNAFSRILDHTEAHVNTLHEKLASGLHRLFLTFHTIERNFVQSTTQLETQIRSKEYRINLLAEKITNIYQRSLTETKQKIEVLYEKVNGLSPEAILNRGYSITYDKNGKILKQTQDTKVGDEITIRLSEGKISGTVQNIHAE